MTACVASVVRVMPHWICGFSIRSVRVENGSGGSSPGCISQRAPVDGAAVEPRRRAGLQPAERKADALKGRGQAQRRRLADPAGRNLRSPIWIRPRRKVPVVRTTAPVSEFTAVGQLERR